MELRNDARGRHVSEKKAEHILNAVLDSGINFIDTSIDYGASEERIGRYISHRRSEYVLATKCGCPVGVSSGHLSDPVVSFLRRYLRDSLVWKVLRRAASREPRALSNDRHVFTRDNVVSGLEQSLSRMKTDYIDVLQFHHSPTKLELERRGALDAALDLKKQGKVRFIGISSNLPDLAEHIEMGVFDTVQTSFSAFQSEASTQIAKAGAAGVGMIVRGGTGGSGRGGLERDPHIRDLWQRANLGSLLGDMTRMEFSLRFTLSRSDVDTVLVGTTNPNHLSENINAMIKGPLPADVCLEAAQALARVR
jgi:aryl-alcohol dehydrogenase-like predicted oxidoreductase